MKLHTGIAALLTLALGLSPVVAAPDGPALYSTHCAVCHGETGDGGVGVPLSLESFLSSVDDQFLATTIRLGRPGRVMPAFSKLSDSQISAIVRTIRDWSGKPAPVFSNQPVIGDAKKGQALYANHCASCHGEDGEGGNGTGVTFSRKRDLPIIAPALNNPGFIGASSAQMIKHTLMVGRDGTPMNSFLAHGLSEGDIDDIVVWVRAFRSEGREAPAVGDHEPMLVVRSEYGFEETVENVKQVIEGNNFRFIREQLFEEGIAPAGEENPRRMMIYFCNFNFLFEALAIDPRIGLYLPCRITIEERKGKVYVMAVNPLILSELFNNDELTSVCKEMHGIYQSLLEDATL